MKLKDILREIFTSELFMKAHDIQHLKLNSDVLRSIKPYLSQADEFKGASISIGDDVIRTSIDVPEDHQFKGVILIHSIELTGPHYDKDLIRHNDRRPTILPVEYDANDFTPYQRIVLPYCKESFIKDSGECSAHHGSTYDYCKEQIHALLDDMIDNPKKYEQKKNYGIRMTGVFNEIDKTQKKMYLNLE